MILMEWLLIYRQKCENFKVNLQLQLKQSEFQDTLPQFLGTGI